MYTWACNTILGLGSILCVAGDNLQCKKTSENFTQTYFDCRLLSLFEQFVLPPNKDDLKTNLFLTLCSAYIR